MPKEKRRTFIITVIVIAVVSVFLWQLPNLYPEASPIDEGLLTGADDPMGSRNNYYPCEVKNRPADLTFGSYNTYLGDLHLHSVNSHDPATFRATATRENTWAFYDNAKNVLNYDFAVLTDHDNLLTQTIWEEHIATANAWNNTPYFVAAAGYEWSSGTYGHQNVIFRGGDSDNPLLHSADAATDTPAELYSELSDSGKTFLTDANHPDDYDWATFDDTYVRNAEIYQKRGSFEDLEVNRLNEGLVFGFLGTSDRHYFHRVDFVVTGVLAESLTRENIFDALAARRTFAATKPYIYVIFSAWDNVQGTVLNDTYDDIPLRVQASSANNQIEKVEIVKNGTPIGAAEANPLAYTYDNIYTDTDADNNQAYYYARITLTDGSMAWSSPIFFGY